MTKEEEAPIKPVDYIGGLTVIDIGDLRIARGMSLRPVALCRHNRMIYDAKERRIWCPECETTVNAFDAFARLVESYAMASARIEKRRTELAEAEKFQMRHRAAKVMDEAWRSTSMAPACPHCSRGILREDVAKGVAMVGVEFERARRAKPTPK
jgi:hypothetical protein